MLSTPAYLDGKIIPLDECRVSVLDRGFLFGDSIYEMIPVYAGQTFEADAHLVRMARCLTAIGIENPHSHAEWQGIIDLLIQHSSQSDLVLYLQITRGVAPRDHYPTAILKPTVFGMTMPLPERDIGAGFSAITAEDIRWHRCDIKTTSLAANVLLRKRSTEAKVHETILIRDGCVTEGAVSNVFVIVDGIIATAPSDQYILPGITRDVVIRLATEHNIPLEERAVKAEVLTRATEVWTTSSTKDISPIVSIDGSVVGNGKPGPVWKKFTSWIHNLRM